MATAAPPLAIPLLPPSGIKFKPVARPLHHHPDLRSSVQPPLISSVHPVPVPSRDPYYGHEYIARRSARFITHLFACPEYPPSSTHHQAKLPFFIAYALHRTKLHSSVTCAALVLLQRLKARFPSARGSSGHRLFISAFMIASKVMCDDTYSNKSWSIVAQGMFNLREINQMEREMCSYLEWDLTVDAHTLAAFEFIVKRDFRGPGPYPNYPLHLVSKRLATPNSITACHLSGTHTGSDLSCDQQHSSPTEPLHSPPPSTPHIRISHAPPLRSSSTASIPSSSPISATLAASDMPGVAERPSGWSLAAATVLSQRIQVKANDILCRAASMSIEKMFKISSSGHPTLWRLYASSSVFGLAQAAAVDTSQPKAPEHKPFVALLLPIFFTILLVTILVVVRWAHCRRSSPVVANQRTPATHDQQPNRSSFAPDVSVPPVAHLRSTHSDSHVYPPRAVLIMHNVLTATPHTPPRRQWTKPENLIAIVSGILSFIGIVITGLSYTHSA